MTNPLGMVVCHSGRQLFILDDSEYIWRVSADDHWQYDMWLQTKYVIQSLSVTSQRLLLTPRVSFGDCGLRLYSSTDAAQIGVVRLPEYMWWLHHAVETTRGTCVVAHEGTSQDGDKCAVSRVVTCCVALFISCEYHRTIRHIQRNRVNHRHRHLLCFKLMPELDRHNVKSRPKYSSKIFLEIENAYVLKQPTKIKFRNCKHYIYKLALVFHAYNLQHFIFAVLERRPIQHWWTARNCSM